MSAYVVDREHIDEIVQAALDLPEYEQGFGWYHGDQWHRIDALAQPGDEKPGFIPGYSTELVPPSVIGQRLVDENVRSVHDRYPDTDPDTGDLPGPCDAYYMGPYVFTAPADRGIKSDVGTIARLAKRIKSYEYQACEHDDWESSEAHAFCRALKDRLLEALPAYEDAVW